MRSYIYIQCLVVLKEIIENNYMVSTISGLRGSGKNLSEWVLHKIKTAARPSDTV